MGQCIALLSGKGGTGKSAACAGLSLALAALGKRVLAVDLDVGLPQLELYLNLADTPTLSFLEIASYGLSKATVHPEAPNLHFLTAPVNARPGELRQENFGKFLEKCKKKYDFILLDCPAGLGEWVTLAAKNADRCLVVAGIDPASVRAAGRTADALELLGVPESRLLLSRLWVPMLKSLGLTVDDIMDQTGLPLLGLVPEDDNIPLCAAAGKMLPRRSPAAVSFGRIAKRILGENVPISIK